MSAPFVARVIRDTPLLRRSLTYWTTGLGQQLWNNGLGTVGGARRDRTADLVIANDALSQLSYGPLIGRAEDGCGGQERPFTIPIMAKSRTPKSMFSAHILQKWTPILRPEYMQNSNGSGAVRPAPGQFSPEPPLFASPRTGIEAAVHGSEPAPLCAPFSTSSTSSWIFTSGC